MRDSRTVIGFTAEVQVSKTIDADHVFQVLVNHSTPDDPRSGFVCRCPIRGGAIPVKLNLDQEKVVNAAGHIDAASEAPAGRRACVAFLLDLRFRTARRRHSWPAVLLISGSSCAVILFSTLKERPSMPSSRARNCRLATDQRNASLFGIQGGLFESWFTVKRRLDSMNHVRKC